MGNPLDWGVVAWRGPLGDDYCIIDESTAMLCAIGVCMLPVPIGLSIELFMEYSVDSFAWRELLWPPPTLRLFDFKWLVYGSAISTVLKTEFCTDYSKETQE